MTAVLALALVGEMQVRSLTLPPGAAVDRLIRLEVPAGQATRVVFPEAALGIKYSPGAREHLGLRLAAVQPHGVVLLNPPRHPGRGTMDFRGPTLHLVLEIETADHGVGSEVRLTMPPPLASLVPRKSQTPAANPPTSVPATGPGPSAEADAPTETTGSSAASNSATQDAAQAPIGTPERSMVSESEPSREALSVEASPQSPPAGPSITAESIGEASSTIDLQALLKAEASRIDRVEGLAGQRLCTLAYLYTLKTDADERVWLRFYLAGAGTDRVEAVGSSWGEVGSFFAETVGKDLMVVVQAPAREARSKHSWIELRFARAGRYRFSSLTSPSVARSLKKLFGVGH